MNFINNLKKMKTNEWIKNSLIRWLIDNNHQYIPVLFCVSRLPSDIGSMVNHNGVYFGFFFKKKVKADYNDESIRIFLH